jgi:hypothetical protein
MLLAVPGFAQTGAQSYTPRRESSAPAYVNAEVVRVDRAAGTATIRAESGDPVLIADRDALPEAASLKAGDKVVVAYEVIVDEDGRARRLVTYLRPASPTSGEPGPSFVVASAGAGGATVRVLSTDRANRRITVTDLSGSPVVLPVSTGAARSLSALSAGDVVGLSFGGGGVVSANALPAVSGIQALPAGTAVGNFVVPPFTGQFVGFEPGANLVTVRSTTGQLRSFPVSSAAGSGFIGLVPGENLSLGFQVTQEANRARIRAGAGASTTTVSRTGLSGLAGTTPGVLSVGSVQSVGPFNQAGFPTGAGSPQVARNTASPNAPGLTNVSGATAQTGNVGPQTGAQTGANAGNAGGPIGAATGGGLPFIGGGIGVPSVAGAVSPYASTVPSVPSPTPVFNAVLPPATAKAPLSQDEVGVLRAYGERDLDAAAMVLAMVANEIDAAWARFKVGCLGGFVPESAPNREWFLLLDGRVRTPTDDQCRAMYTQLQGLAAGFDQQLGIALDAARRADVLPGRVREILERHRIDR